MNTSRHHADWLSLVEVSGPFVSLPVLLRVFPQGLDAREPAQAKALRAGYDEWQKNPAAPGRQRAWILHVLTDLLGYTPDLITEGQTLPAGLEANVAQMGETLRPDFALVGAKNTETADQAHLLISTYPSSQGLDRPAAERHWKANPATRMMELLHASDVPLGLVTNGEQWMLVYAPRGETTGYGSWYGALWLDEPITLRAFHSLLGVHRFFGVDAANTLLGLLKESAQDQQEVTDQLGYQVREAVQVLVQAFDTLDQDANRTLLKGLAETGLYDAALTVMMRLVFLFSAEERGLLHLGKPLYDDNYAVSTLMGQLQEVADLFGPQVLERRCDAWARLLAIFRAIHGGVNHQDLLMPAYGGSLFDPDRYPFLEGRAAGTKWANTQAELLDVNNRVVLHLLSSLQRLRMKVSGGGPSESRRISFRALDVEQIGHVYEGLLDHTAVRATEPVLGMKGTRDKETEIPLAKLEAILAKGQAALVEFLHDETGRSEKAIARALKEEILGEEHQLLIACGHDAGLLQRVRAFADLIREDSFERPVVVLPGSIYVTAGTKRRSTGTHYTPPSLTEPIVQYTLEPLVYEGPAQGLPKEEWELKSPKEILELKVCDMAMGSGAFLVQACRYLSERLVESWENEEKKHPHEILITPEGGFSEGVPNERLIPADATERLAIARRIVADRCLYGVDINPMAVEMAKLSMWLITLDANRPFTFLDHAFKSGDTLLGVASLEQLENFSLRANHVQQQAFSTLNLWRHIDEATKKRVALEAMASDTPTQVATKTTLYNEAEEAVAKLNAAADILIALELAGYKGSFYEEEREAVADRMMFYWAKGLPELKEYANESLNGRRCLHWALAFPEIVKRRGFDAVVGNPPYLGAPKLTGTYGNDYRGFLVTHLAHEVKGLADLCAYFVLRVPQIIREDGFCGLLVTSAISEGDTRTVGLEQINAAGWKIFRATSRAPWPGTANVTYSSIWLTGSGWNGEVILDDEAVFGITPLLTSQQDITGPPHRLKANLHKSFNGVKVYGDGFVLESQEAGALIKRDPQNRSVLFPYVTTKDVNSHPQHAPSTWAIRFFDWPLDRESAPNGYFGPVAADFPDCLSIIEARVKPERTRRDADGNFVVRDPMPRLWWIYGEKRPGLYSAISKLKHVLAVGTQATKYVAFAVLPIEMVFSHSLSIIADDSFSVFAILTSSIHEVWARQYGGYNLALLRYSPTDVLETFPFPEDVAALETIGNCYHELRREAMLRRQEGLTELYNRFHDPREQSDDIVRLRKVQSELDEAVRDAFVWHHLPLEHGFHKTRQGIRFTISSSARSKVLNNLLELNHRLHAEEKAEEMLLGKQTKTTGKRGSKKSDPSLAFATLPFDKE
jgi:hypothetical protein